MSNARAFPVAADVRVPGSHWDGDLAADIFAPCGTPALAVFGGWATPQDFSLGGSTVRLIADDGVEAYYAHLSDQGRASGRVSAGDVIGYVSNSGNANKRGDGQCHDDEAHIHFAVGRINSNGGGTIRPADFFAGLSGGSSPILPFSRLATPPLASAPPSGWWALAS